MRSQGARRPGWDRGSPALQVLRVHGSPLLQEEAAQTRVAHLSRYDEGRCAQLAGVGGVGGGDKRSRKRPTPREAGEPT